MGAVTADTDLYNSVNRCFLSYVIHAEAGTQCWNPDFRLGENDN